jgi:hypothetical protein
MGGIMDAHRAPEGARFTILTEHLSGQATAPYTTPPPFLLSLSAPARRSRGRSDARFRRDRDRIASSARSRCIQSSSPAEPRFEVGSPQNPRISAVLPFRQNCHDRG